ncbi:MAG: zinc-ribbon domain-containing protein [Anaerolineae bacterium]|jgi:hypothetical protein
MSIGSILVGVAVALLVAAYLARPFRPTRAGGDIDRSIETWVARAQSDVPAELELEPERSLAPQREEVAEPVNFCPQCGRRVGPDDRFCAGCGRRLPGGGA